MKGNRHGFLTNMKIEDVKMAINNEIAFIGELIEEIEKVNNFTGKHPGARVRDFFARKGAKEVMRLNKKLKDLIFWAGIFSIYEPQAMVTLNMDDARLFNISGCNI